MIQAIALDDSSALICLDVFCQRAKGIKLSRTFTHPHQAELFLQHNQIDLVFLEPYVQAESGVNFWHTIRRHTAETKMTLPMLVFATAHSEYAQISYELEALDYLLKPFSFERFLQTLQKATDQLYRQQTTPGRPARYRSFRIDHGLINVNLVDITCVEASGNYCKLYLDNQRPLVIRITMKALLHELSSLGFTRVHRSYIVALQHITSVHHKFIQLGEKQVPIGVNYERMVYNQVDALAHSSQ